MSIILIKYLIQVSIRSITSPYRVVVTKCVISHLSAIWDRMVILITLLIDGTT